MANGPSVPEIRIRDANGRDPDPRGDYVLYWMVAARRRRANFALQRALELARELERPLLVFEPLRCGYRWASDRLHAFVLQGMADNRADFADAGVRHLAYVEPAPGAGRGLFRALAARACCVVSDDFPCFFLPRMVAAAAARTEVRFEVVDGNGLLPMRSADRRFARAFDFRRWLQKSLRPHLHEFPTGDPLRGYDLGTAEVCAEVCERWPMAGDELLQAAPAALRSLPIDHDVGPAGLRGGPQAAGRQLRRFLRDRFERYANERQHPDADCASELSSYLHFGHISAHQVFAGIAKREDWSSGRLAATASGKRGWFGMSPNAEAFLEQLVVWRELGFNFAWQCDDPVSYESLPEWARNSLAAHADDVRPYLYTPAELAESRTHDDIWNAAQRQLRESGVLHNYLRMLWGKKVLEWSPTPQQALTTLIDLNNRYALDGRDPNSYSGITWIFGRYDRPWGPQRDVFGSVRYMTSANTRRKLRMSGYLARWGAQ